MAFYDQFAGKKKNPRDDWRDDAQTRRPKRDHENVQMKEKDFKKPVRGQQKFERENGDGYRQERNRGYEDRNTGSYGKGTVRTDRSGDGRQYGKNQGAAGGRGDRGAGKRSYDERRPFNEKHAFDGRNSSDGRNPERGSRAFGMSPETEHEAENLLVGRNPIREALKSGRDMEKLLVARGELMGSAREIVAMAREQHVVVQEVDRVRLDAMAPNHQGMIAVVSAYEYHTLEDIFARAADKNEDPFIVVLDGIMDPHNLGAIIRSAECAGAHGVIIPTRRAAGLTPAAVKASAGAVEHIPVVRETNLSRTLEYLKKEGCWVFGTAMNGKNYRSTDFTGPVVLVIGSEGDGISKLVSDHCDDMVTIPMYGEIDSLNASVAAGIVLFAIAEKRGAR